MNTITVSRALPVRAFNPLVPCTREEASALEWVLGAFFLGLALGLMLRR